MGSPYSQSKRCLKDFNDLYRVWMGNIKMDFKEIGVDVMS